MDLFKRIFNQKRISTDDSPKKTQMIEDGKDQKNSAADQQYIGSNP